MKYCWQLILLVACLSAYAWGLEVVWLRVTPELTYQSNHSRCSSQTFLLGLFLAAEVDDEGRTEALVMSVFPGSSKRIELRPEELKGVSFYQDKWGNFWLDKFTVGARLLRWLFEQSFAFECAARRQPLRTLTPDPVGFLFDLKAVKEGIPVSHSAWSSFSGTHTEQIGFEGRVKFVQRKKE